MADPLSKKAYQTFEKLLKEKCPGGWAGTANTPSKFGVFDREGKVISALQGHACHANVNFYCTNESIVVNAHGKHSADYPEFTKWVCKDSPFAKGVLNKDNDDLLLHNGTILDADIIGKGGCLWVCKAARHVIEDTHKPKVWMTLRECGLDGLQAFIGSDILQSTGKPQTSHTHPSLFRYTSPAEIRRAYDEIKVGPKITDSNAARPTGWNYYQGEVWGTLTSKKERRSDGWGGFVEVEVPCDAKEYAAKLKEIFEGDPKNVRK